MPAIDEAGLAAAREADRLLAAARNAGNARWIAYLDPIPDRLRDAGIKELRATARLARAAYGTKASLRDDFPEHLTEPFLVAVDRLIRLIVRAELERD
jgi:hypothetical protein